MIELTGFGRRNSKFFITYQHFCHEFLAGHQLHQSLHGAHRPTPIIHHWFIRGIWRPDVSEETARGLDRQIQQLRWKASKSGNIAILVDLVEVMHEQHMCVYKISNENYCICLYCTCFAWMDTFPVTPEIWSTKSDISLKHTRRFSNH